MTAIGAMFTTWKPLFKSKMKDGEWDIATVKLWTLALTEMNITPDEFATAHKKSLALEWQPTTPADFIKLVRHGGISDLPEIRKAYNDGANSKYEHEVVYETCRRIGFMAMHEGVERETYPKWREVYPRVCDEYRQGTRFTLPETNLIEQKRPVASPDFVDKLLNGLRKQLVGTT